jgi:hypothetical protein
MAEFLKTPDLGLAIFGTHLKVILVSGGEIRMGSNLVLFIHFLLLALQV